MRRPILDEPLGGDGESRWGGGGETDRQTDKPT